ncbi:isopentenyl-diphosphate Delta-isomerase [Candidatus Gottesmanbacteria bacterium]|nr:isopentenyl-diphosphate Delta-isomerase [Candidatus Gottesmanbacteria bacterium]
MELVVLVDDANMPIGTADKDTVHTKDTPLHRAFSLFLFNTKNQVLLTKRASTKKTFPGVWTNAVCGHLSVNETPVAAAERRLKEELGITGVTLREIAPYRYRFADKNGIVENEICPILVGFTDNDPIPNLLETEEWKWMEWGAFLADIKNNPDPYSPWSREEAEIISSLLPPINQEMR